MIIANWPLLRYNAVPFVFGGRMFNSAPPGKRANSPLTVPFVEPFTKVDVITGVVVKLVDELLTSSLLKCVPFVPFDNECC